MVSLQENNPMVKKSSRAAPAILWFCVVQWHLWVLGNPGDLANVFHNDW
jgi:hypothetical protein